MRGEEAAGQKWQRRRQRQRRQTHQLAVAGGCLGPAGVPRAVMRRPGATWAATAPESAGMVTGKHWGLRRGQAVSACDRVSGARVSERQSPAKAPARRKKDGRNTGLDAGDAVRCLHLHCKLTSTCHTPSWSKMKARSALATLLLAALVRWCSSGGDVGLWGRPAHLHGPAGHQGAIAPHAGVTPGLGRSLPAQQHAS